MRSLRVVRPGARTTVQDGGRIGFAHLGVPVAGAVDIASMRTANAAVGNAPDAALLESTLGGDVFSAEADITVAVVGSRADGVVSLDAGETVRVAKAAGVYVYVAVAGGIDVTPVLGSRSYDALSGLGPPPLRAGDVLPIGELRGTAYDVETVTRSGPLRVWPGPHGALDALVGAQWTVTPRSDRVALRLAGPVLDCGLTGIPSEGLVPGAVQVPPDGQPVLFVANHPVTGGYPVIAVVATDDIGRAAQTRPGGTLRFTPIAASLP